MLAIDRTTNLFIESVKDALPHFRVTVERSRTSFGRSNYVFIRDADGRQCWKVRVSDHQIGMNRFFDKREDLLLQGGDRPGRWSVWLSEFVKRNT